MRVSRKATQSVAESAAVGEKPLQEGVEKLKEVFVST